MRSRVAGNGLRAVIEERDAGHAGAVLAENREFLLRCRRVPEAEGAIRAAGEDPPPAVFYGDTPDAAFVPVSVNFALSSPTSHTRTVPASVTGCDPLPVRG